MRLLFKGTHESSLPSCVFSRIVAHIHTSNTFIFCSWLLPSCWLRDEGRNAGPEAHGDRVAMVYSDPSPPNTPWVNNNNLVDFQGLNYNSLEFEHMIPRPPMLNERDIRTIQRMVHTSRHTMNTTGRVFSTFIPTPRQQFTKFIGYFRRVNTRFISILGDGKSQDHFSRRDNNEEEEDGEGSP